MRCAIHPSPMLGLGQRVNWQRNNSTTLHNVSGNGSFLSNECGPDVHEKHASAQIRLRSLHCRLQTIVHFFIICLKSCIPKINLEPIYFASGSVDASQNRDGGTHSQRNDCFSDVKWRAMAADNKKYKMSNKELTAAAPFFFSAARGSGDAIRRHSP